jgi:hypothetical protein
MRKKKNVSKVLFSARGAHCSLVDEALCYKPEGHGFETR